jgi:hypothetical protein
MYKYNIQVKINSLYIYINHYTNENLKPKYCCCIRKRPKQNKNHTSYRVTMTDVLTLISPYQVFRQYVFLMVIRILCLLLVNSL